MSETFVCFSPNLLDYLQPRSPLTVYDYSIACFCTSESCILYFTTLSRDRRVRRDVTRQITIVTRARTPTFRPQFRHRLSAREVKQGDVLYVFCLEVVAETRPSLRLQPYVGLVNARGQNPTYIFGFSPVLYLDLQPERSPSVHPSTVARPVGMEADIQRFQRSLRATREDLRT